MIRDNKAKTFLVSAPIAHRQLKYFSCPCIWAVTVIKVVGKSWTLLSRNQVTRITVISHQVKM